MPEGQQTQDHLIEGVEYMYGPGVLRYPDDDVRVVCGCSKRLWRFRKPIWRFRPQPTAPLLSALRPQRNEVVLASTEKCDFTGVRPRRCTSLSKCSDRVSVAKPAPSLRSTAMSAVNSASSTASDLAADEIRHTVSVVQQPVLQPYVDSARYARCVEVSRRI